MFSQDVAKVTILFDCELAYVGMVIVFSSSFT